MARQRRAPRSDDRPLAVCPFGCWRTLVAGEIEGLAQGEPLFWLVREYAGIYEACAARFHMRPREVDDLEVWEVAALLGLHRPPPEDGDDPNDGIARAPKVHDPTKPRRMSEMTSAEVIKQRILHSQDPDRYPLPIQDAGIGGASLATALGGVTGVGGN